MEDYYICIKCGAGPQYPKEYVAGSMCPKCGSGNMGYYSPYKNEMYQKLTHYICRDCDHKI